MTGIVDQNYYEILEISPDAALQEIERAYRVNRSTYQPSGLATYSVFSDDENAHILERIEEAYTVLSDARARREYDARLRRAGVMLAADATVKTPALAPAATHADSSTSKPASKPESLELDDGYDPEDGVFEGSVLRRIRLSLGLELDEISAQTKIDGGFLISLETNCYRDLPAEVYVRGYLKQYARCLRLDPERVVDSYLTRMREDRSAE
ncbi:MAG: helix-turn-helix domain-containing protein [Myxococcales bacterium]|nr:helix-turn-helix domain-containing protein [Myxococcales bacterium]